MAMTSRRPVKQESTAGAGDSFATQPWAGNPHLQTIFGSLKIRLRGPNPMLECARETIVNGGEGARLLGYHSLRPENRAAALVLLLHGWEGSSESTYILSAGRYLFEKGCDIFRLNLRDHGNSHHLNEGLFHGALTAEAVQAAKETAGLARGNFYIAGFSLGGNFALRIALAAPAAGIANLKEVFAVSPSLDPLRATVAIDDSLLYRRYFLKKWKRSLMKKQSLFPHRYDFREVQGLQTCMEVTKAIMTRYSDFPSCEDYFRRYTLTGNALAGLSVPVTVIASEDDPIIPIDDLYGVNGGAYLKPLIQKRGGHCGFLSPFPSGCWSERKIYEIIAGHEAGGS